MSNVTPKLGKGLGRKIDAPDERDFRLTIDDFRFFQSPIANQQSAISAPLPTSVDVFAGLNLPVYDQGTLGSCTANAGALYRRFLAQKFSKYSATDEDLSRLFLYYQERRLDGDVASDAGASVRDTFKVLSSIGVCPESSDPYDPAHFSMPLWNDTPDQFELAVPYKIGAYHRVMVVETAKNVLASGYAIELGFTVYKSFEDIGGDGVMPMPKSGEQILGGHAVVIRGYDDSREMFFAQNSWGPGWGSGGCFWMPYEYITRTEISEPDLWMGHLGKPW